MNKKQKAAVVAAIFIDLAALAHIIFWYNTPEVIKGLIDTIPLWASITTLSFLSLAILGYLGYLGYNKRKLDQILFLIVEKDHSLIDKDDKTFKWIFKSLINNEKKLKSILLYRKYHVFTAIDNEQTEKLRIIIDSIKNQSELLKKVLLNTYGRGETPLYTTMSKNGTDMFNIIFNSIKDKPELLKEVLLALEGTQFNPVHNAITEMRADIFKIILDSIKDKADLLKNVLLAENGSGKTTLERAMNRGDIELIRVMASEEVINCLGPKENLTVNQIKCKKLLELAKQIFEYNNNKPTGEALIQLIKNKENLNLIKNNTAMLKLVLLNLDALVDENNIDNILSKLIKDNTSNLKPVMLYLVDLGNTKADTIGKILELIKDDNENLKRLLEDKNENGETLLDLAITRNHYVIFEKILEKTKYKPEILIIKLFSKDTQDSEKILEKIKDKPIILKYLLSYISYANVNIIRAMISEEVINCLSPEEALEVLQMKAPNDNSNFAGLTVYEILILSPPPLSKECILLNSIGAGAKNPFIGIKEEQIIRSMSFSDLAAHKKISNSIEAMPSELVNIMTEYTHSTVEQLQFWEFLRSVLPHEDESIYKQRLGLAKQIFEYNFAIDKDMKEIPEEFITDLNEKIKSAEKKLKWSPVTWANIFGFIIPEQSAKTDAHEETKDHNAMPSNALNTPTPMQTNLTQARDKLEESESKFNPR